MMVLIILISLIWIAIGFGCLYQYMKWENMAYYKEKLDKFDYLIISLFSFIGTVAIFILLLGYFANRKNIKEYKKRKISEMSLKQIRRNKLKKINRFRIWA
jgi:hypothetical protein